jgi:hypothetical protein
MKEITMHVAKQIVSQLLLTASPPLLFVSRRRHTFLS